MISVRDLYVKSGDLVIPAWRRLVEHLASLPVLPGVGTLVRRTSRGTIVSARAAAIGFSGSWNMGQPSGGLLPIGDGYINGLVPSVHGKLLIPADSQEKRPVLQLKKDRYDDTGRSWICIQVQVDPETNRIPQGDKNSVTIVQSDHPYLTEEPYQGRHPLAVLVRPPKNFQSYGSLHRIVYFDLQHRFVPDKKRHFFYV